ncbi:MAG: mycofactocin biosynthesis glycosyltransferase MftF [Acidimicrobiia bacterium]
MTGPGLPPGFGLRLDPATRRLDDGRVLLGGRPRRLVRLTSTGARLVDRLEAGEAVPAAPPAQRLARRLLDGGLAHPRPDASTRPYGPLDVSVVIPVHVDDVAGLGRTLRSLGPCGEVVVVDDGSVARLDVARCAEAQGARLLRHDRPHGPAAARETGWRAARRPVVAFVDAGVEVRAGWLDALLDHLADPAVGAVAPRVVAAGGATRRWIAAYEAVRSPLDLGTAEAAVGSGTTVSYVPTATLVVRREALEDVGGFDEELRFGEDVDLVWRLGRRWTVRYDPRVAVVHAPRPTAARWLRQRVDYGSSAGPLARRHGAAVAPWRASAWSTAVCALVAARRPGAALAVGTAGAAVLARRLHPVPGRTADRTRAVARTAALASGLAATAHLSAGRQLVEALRRPWFPLTVALAAPRRTRPVALAVLALPPLVEWARDRPGLDPLRWEVLRLADDVAYGAGVWWGALRHGAPGALLPRPGGTGVARPLTGPCAAPSA